MDRHNESDARERILDAAFNAFMKRGYASTSTLEIATEARVSKRELYALVGNKQEMLTACITARAERFKVPKDLPVPGDREQFGELLVTFGSHLFREISDPTVIAVFRIAIAEALNAPEVAKALDSIGREATRSALRQVMSQALNAGLVDGNAAELAEQFSGLLWGNSMVALLLGVMERPSAREIATRARETTAAFLQLHPAPKDTEALGNREATSRQRNA